MRVEPSLLLHPLDFLGGEDDSDLSFFPAMKSEAKQKIALVGEVVDLLQRHYRIVTMEEHARAVAARLRADSLSGQFSAAKKSPSLEGRGSAAAERGYGRDWTPGW